MDFKAYIHHLWFWDLDRPASRQINAKDFVVRPLSLLKYPSVVFPALYVYVSVKRWRMALGEPSE